MASYAGVVAFIAPHQSRGRAAQITAGNTERICPYAKMFRQGIDHVVALAPDASSAIPDAAR